MGTFLLNSEQTKLINNQDMSVNINQNIIIVSPKFEENLQYNKKKIPPVIISSIERPIDNWVILGWRLFLLLIFPS